MSDTQNTPMQCRHVFTDGHRCLGHCLRHEPFCYFHHTARRPISNPAARRRRGTTFTLPELEDRASIQLALSEILQRIAANDLDPKRAGHLLYGLQIAASLLPKLDPKAQPKSVSEITHDEELGDLAPAAEVGHDKELSDWELLIQSLRNPRPKDPEPEPTEDAAEEPEEILPTIQAVADPNSNPKSQLLQLHAKSLFALTCTKPLRVPPRPPRSQSPLLPTPYSLLPALRRNLILKVQILPPVRVRRPDHPHNVPARVQAERPRLAQQTHVR